MSSDPHDQLFAVFRHEAGTPLAVVGGALRQLDRTGLDGDQRELLESALRQIEVLQRLVDQLHLSEQEELPLARAELDLGELAAAVVRDLGATVLGSHRCEVDAPDAPVCVLGDGPRLRQVLSNLLDNAAKYSPEDTVIRVVVRRDGDEAVLAVVDQGTGLADPDLVRVFRRYERASEDTAGLGLGLWVVWRVVDAHGGTVRAERAPDGPGARFVVRLPAAPA